jgi:hypothetical protein
MVRRDATTRLHGSCRRFFVGIGARAALAVVVAALDPAPGTSAEPAAATDPATVRDLRIEGPVDAAAAYAALAEAWGLELAIEGAPRPVELRVDLERMTRDEALDLLTTAAGDFWWVDERGVVRIALDTPNNQRQARRAVRRTYRAGQADPSELRTALLSLTGARAEAIDDGVVVETSEASLADRVVAAMEGPLPAEGTLEWLGSESRLRPAAPDPRLGTEPRRRLWSGRPRRAAELYRAIESAFDVDLVVDPAISDGSNGSLRLEHATLFEALDAVTVPAGRSWSVLHGRRIVISDDTPARRLRWEPIGLLAVPVRHVRPQLVRSVLRDLVRQTAAGSSPPVVLVMGRPDELALARFVIETLDRDVGERAATVPARRLWLGEGLRPRPEAQLLADPRVDAARRESYADALPPALGPVPASQAAARHQAYARATAPRRLARRSLAWLLEEELGLHVGLERCHWPANPRGIPVHGLADAGRVEALQQLAAEHALLWTVVGPDTVRLAPDVPYFDEYAPHRGIAVVPLGSARAGTIRELASELRLEKTVEATRSERLLFAVGRWADLETLLAAAGEVAEPPRVN